MKKIILAVLCFLMICTNCLEAQATEISRRYEVTAFATAKLTISPSALATCEITARLYDTIDEGTVNMTLYKENGTTWEEIKSWEKQFGKSQENVLTLRRTYYVYEEGTYILTGSVDVTTSKGSDYIELKSSREDYP